MNKAVIGAVLIALILVSLLGLGSYWSQTPDLFDVTAVAKEKTQAAKLPIVTGTITTTTTIQLAETLLHKPGGYISNDILPPSAWLDNISNWEFGVLTQVRDMSRVMRNTFSRSQSQSKEDQDLSRAQARFNISSDSWAFPSAESQYQEGIDALYQYLNNLSDAKNQNAQFYARADNLRSWLEIVEVRLGDLSQRLSASVAQQRVDTSLAGDDVAKQSTHSAADKVVKTPWLEIDDNFYEARGYAWSLIELLRAAQIDFADVLKKKNADASMEQIIRDLEASQRPLSSPMILNGGGFGLWANYSLVMASYLARANAAIIDLRALLEKG